MGVCTVATIIFRCLWKCFSRRGLKCTTDDTSDMATTADIHNRRGGIALFKSYKPKLQFLIINLIKLIANPFFSVCSNSATHCKKNLKVLDTVFLAALIAWLCLYEWWCKT